MAQRFLKKAKNNRVEWHDAHDVKIQISNLVSSLDLKWIKESQILCFRSNFTKTSAYARIWGLSRVWQLALKKEPFYIIEVVSEKYDKLSKKEQEKILIHELAHIPRNFSGALVPHFRRGKRKFNDIVNQLVAQYGNS